MIIAKSALDRGFAHGAIIKAETTDLRSGAQRSSRGSSKARCICSSCDASAHAQQ